MKVQSSKLAGTKMHVTIIAQIRLTKKLITMTSVELLHSKIYPLKFFKIFTWITRILLALGFLPSGMIKFLGNRFTQIPIDNPIGFFFEALYRAGWYWNFLGFIQLFAAVLLVIPRTAFAGALIYFPVILNILIIVCAMNFDGTPYIVGLMMIANLYLLLWDYEKLKRIVAVIFES